MDHETTEPKRKKRYPWVTIVLVVCGLLLVVTGNYLSTVSGPQSQQALPTRSIGFLIAISGLLVFLISNLFKSYVPKTPSMLPTIPKLSAELGAGEPDAHGISRGVLRTLQQTRPWVTTMGVVCFIVGGLTILSGVFIGLATPFQSGRLSLQSGLFLVALMSIVLGILCYLCPGYLLLRYARAITSLVESPSESRLEDALREQKKFWMFVTILVLAVSGFYMLRFFFGLIFVSRVFAWPY